jgi:uncharacterized protein (DUF3084 family)
MSKELEAMTSQSRGLQTEYDRLLSEYEQLEKQKQTAGSGDKKDD